MIKSIIGVGFAVLMLMTGCKSEAPEPVVEPAVEPAAAPTATCEGVFNNMVKLCRAHVQCRPTVASLNQERAPFIASCEKSAKKENLECAANADSWPAFLACKKPAPNPPKP